MKPEEGKWKSEEEEGPVKEIKEQFAIAEDYVQLAEEENKPEKLLSRAERSLEALRNHQNSTRKESRVTSRSSMTPANGARYCSGLCRIQTPRRKTEMIVVGAGRNFIPVVSDDPSPIGADTQNG
jgi:hypothetical protein